MDDDELIAAAAAGDDSALRELFSRHAPWLAARLRSVLPAPPKIAIARPVGHAARVWSHALTTKIRETETQWSSAES